jgi:hypothetical protein
MAFRNTASILLPKFRGFIPIEKLGDHYKVARDADSKNEIEKH